MSGPSESDRVVGGRGLLERLLVQLLLAVKV